MIRLIRRSALLAVASVAALLFLAAAAMAVTCSIENGAATTTSEIVEVDWDLGANTNDTEYAYRVDTPTPPPQDSDDWNTVISDPAFHWDLVDLGDVLGVHTVYYWFREDAGDTTYDQCSDSIKLVEYRPPVDKTKPVARVGDVTARYGGYAVVKYYARDEQSGLRSIVVKIRGTTLKSSSTYPSDQAPTTCQATWRFRCKMRPGTYRMDMTVKDQAGNVTRRSAVLRVR
jgi:hypothetical protein